MNILTHDTLGGVDRSHGERSQDSARHRTSELHAPGGRSSAGKRQTTEYRFLFTLTFAVFFIAAIVEALISFCLRGRGRGDGNEGIYQRAKFGAETCVKYAFMG